MKLHFSIAAAEELRERRGGRYVVGAGRGAGGGAGGARCGSDGGVLAAVLGVPGGLPARQGAVQPAPPLGRAGEGRLGAGGAGRTPKSLGGGRRGSPGPRRRSVGWGQ